MVRKVNEFFQKLLLRVNCGKNRLTEEGKFEEIKEFSGKRELKSLLRALNSHLTTLKTLQTPALITIQFE